MFGRVFVFFRVWERLVVHRCKDVAAVVLLVRVFVAR